jgi:hypothetical protein
MKNFVFCLFIFCLSLTVAGQTIGNVSSPDSALANIAAQFAYFPQEKIYMQTDKPYYISGEKIFFRIYLLNAFSNQPANGSRYVYVELINSIDSVSIRQQIRSQKGLFYGALVLPEDLPQGSYRIRAYTRYMENAGEAFFYTRPVYIADPNAVKLEMETDFEYLNEKQVGVNLRFLDAATQEIQTPDRIPLRLNDGKTVNLKPDKDGWVHAKFNLPEKMTQRTLYVEYGSGKKLFGEYLQIPFPEETIDVSLYPEGGNIIEGKPCKIAFKALLPDGSAAEISGQLFNSQDELLSEFSSKHDGMGSFVLISQPEEEYYVVCHYQNQSVKVDMPKPKTNTLALQTVWLQERLFVTVNKPDSMPAQKLYLLIHNNGFVTCFKEWNFSKDLLQFDKKTFPTGISHLLLLTENFQPVSERLIFVNSDDHVTAEIFTPKRTYKKRELVKMDVRLNNVSADSIPDNFSISVTDDKDVVIDTTTNILAEILLASELKGYIHNPAYYFQKKDRKVETDADLLMLTQGWNRFNIPEIMRGNFQLPTIAPEISHGFSGIVKGGLFSKPYKNANVTLLLPGNGFFDMKETDEEGRFTFNNFEFPDSMAYVIQALTRKGADRVELYLDEITYPNTTASRRFPTKTVKKSETDFMDYVSKADLKYTYENGMRIINLPEVTVKSTKKKEPKEKNSYDIDPDYSITEEQLEKFPAIDLANLLIRLPGVMVSGNKVSIARFSGNSGSGPLFVIDGMRLESAEDAMNMVNVNDVAQIDLIKDGAKLVLYGSGASNGVIEIMTKRGGGVSTRIKYNLTNITPLGYQLPVEFYSPKYDTKEAFNNNNPDLRSVIYWNPSVSADVDGKASLDFYTADSPSSYSAIIEGVSPDGKLIYSRIKSVVTVE